MMAAIIGAVLLIDRQAAGLLSGYALFLFPLPMVFYAAKYGFRDSMVVLAGIAGLSFILSAPQTMYFVCFASVIGLVYGCGVHRGDDNHRILIRNLVLSVLAEVLALIVFAAFFGYDLSGEVSEYETMIESVFSTTQTAVPVGLNMQSMVRTIFVLSVIITGLMEGAVTHLLSRLMLKRMRIKMPPSKSLMEIMPGKWTGYVALAMIVGYYYSLYHPFDNVTIQTGIQGAGIIAMIYLVFFGFLGIMVLGSLAWPKAAKYMPWIALAMTMLASLGVSLIGFLYITTDLKERLMKGGAAHASENE